MGFPISSGLLDAMVLSVVNSSDTYGYEITQLLKTAVDVSESTLYPVLRRLQKSGLLETYDKEYNEVFKDSYISLDEMLKKCENLSNIAFIGKSNKEGILVNKLDISKIYNYYKNEEGISPHKVLPVYLKKTEAEEKFGDIND